MQEKFITASVEEAYEIIKKYAKPAEDVEEIPVHKCWGRVAAENIAAGFDDPSFDRSPYDGYAVRSEDIAGASPENPVRLEVVDEISAGMTADVPVSAGKAVRIMTGAPMPEGSDCVVMQEDTDYGESEVLVYRSLGHLENYDFAGENFKKGQLIIAEGTRLSYTDAGVLVALGKTSVKVYRAPRVAVIATGDEVVEPGNPLPPAKIYNSNMYMLMAAAEANGADVVMSAMSGDDLDKISRLVKEASETADVILTSGGINAGKKDIMRKALAEAGAEIHFSRLDVRPGGAVTFASLDGSSIVCLSGNPFSAAYSFGITGKMAIRLCSGESVDLKSFDEICRNNPVKKPLKGKIRNLVNGGEVIRF